MIKFDNIAPITGDGGSVARAALKFLESVENGTAFDNPPLGQAAQIGGKVFYKSLDGIVYDAVIAGVGLNEVDIDVIVPHSTERLRFTRIKFNVVS